MPQDERQDALADAAETDEENSPWEIDVYGVIAHDAPNERARADRPPTAAKAAGYQSDSRTASERVRKFSTRACLEQFAPASSGSLRAANAADTSVRNPAVFQR